MIKKNSDLSETPAAYLRQEIAEMDGYTPGEQPKDSSVIKLNTNENPFPPSPMVSKFLKGLRPERLRLYPDPVGNEVRKAIAHNFGFKIENVIGGNGSDDILTIITRAFAGTGDTIACMEPSYSLYPVLAQIQGVKCRKIPLTEKFALPKDLADQADGAKIMFICRPNAPTGNVFPKRIIEKFCRNFSGIVLIDEAYADFSDDNCLDLIDRIPNVIVSRTLSKSYSLAGLRFGYALAIPEVIEGLMKVKDSYNVDYLTQEIALAAISDRQYLYRVVEQVRYYRKELQNELKELGFSVVPSQSNFIFASPPDRDGERYFNELRKKLILVRYFPGEVTGKYVRITIGDEYENSKLIEATQEIYKK